MTTNPLKNKTTQKKPPHLVASVWLPEECERVCTFEFYQLPFQIGDAVVEKVAVGETPTQTWQKKGGQIFTSGRVCVGIRFRKAVHCLLPHYLHT